ncbi:MAG: indole-3-glycerol phosphate synthase TrpC [Nitrospirae bacterium]|nr:indole-3-glycerol phosphate synthase TrpC [Nitrospirota bacterium]MBI3351805.1 indole-3-glycerol phosphate synthase TrpC [Nitrospirota bacterium]
MFLKEIVDRKKDEVRAKKNKKYLSEMISKTSQMKNRSAGALKLSPASSFQETLSRTDFFPTQTRLHLIAEIKKASPSKGVIREDFNPVEIGQIYEASGASAISVLTEECFFMGSLSILEEVRKKVSLPLLRKDFIIDEIQLMESRAYGADAVLFIAAILDPNQMIEYFHQAQEIGLDVLTEVHSEKELEKVIEWAPIIGINNRDLGTFEVDLKTTRRLRRYIPSNRVIVSESGFSRKEDLSPLIEEGINAVLIGEAFMKEKDIQASVQKLFSKLSTTEGK